VLEIYDQAIAEKLTRDLGRHTTVRDRIDIGRGELGEFCAWTEYRSLAGAKTRRVAGSKYVSNCSST
jgi:hypothetical protein